MKTLFFVDSSYLTLYHHFATLRWIKFNPMMNYNDNYQKLYFKTIRNVIDKYTNKNEYNVIFANDTRRENMWRRQYHNLYKKDKTMNETITTIFDTTQNRVIPALFEELRTKSQMNNGNSVYHKKCEADDIIAIAHGYIRKNEKQPHKIVIISSDNDYIQLLDNNTIITSFYNGNILEKKMKGNMIVCTHINNKLHGVAPIEYLFTKIMNGSKSSGISPVIYNYGLKTCISILNDQQKIDELRQMLSGDLYLSKKFIINKTLFDFNCIPDDIVKDIENTMVAIDVI